MLTTRVPSKTIPTLQDELSCTVYENTWVVVDTWASAAAFLSSLFC